MSSASPVAGACFGYRIRSRSTFELIRDEPAVDGLEELHVVTGGESAATDEEPLLEWHDQGAPFARVWPDGDRFGLWIAEVGWFDIDTRGARIAMPSEDDGVRCETRLWGLPVALCFMRRGDVPLHAAAVEVDGGAVIVAAPGRHGKTTLAAAFAASGHRLLSEDLTCVTTGATPSVLPGPTVLRIRRDVYERLELPGLSVLAEDPDRIYMSVDAERRGDGAPVPLLGIVFLRVGDGPTTMERVATADALRDLWALSFNLPTDEDRSRCFSGVADLAGRVPAWNLHRQLSYDGLPDVIDRIRATCAR